MTKSNLRFRFELSLAAECDPGMIFHAWLPNGEAEALFFREKDHEVKLWVERETPVHPWPSSDYLLDEDDFGEDPSAMAKYSMLEARIIKGELLWSELSSLQIPSAGEFWSEESVGKVMRVLHKRVSAFLQVVKVVHGQYWLAIPEPFNSQEESSESYSIPWNLHFLTREDVWKRVRTGQSFAPAGIVIAYRREHYRDFYLTQNDWSELPSHEAPKVSPALELLERAAVDWANGKFRSAYIEAQSALELAANHVLREHYLTLPDGKKDFDRAVGLGFHFQLSTAICLRGGSLEDDVIKARECAKWRNDIVHHGKDPEKHISTAPHLTDHSRRLEAAFRVILRLVGHPDWKVARILPPHFYHGLP